MIDDTFVPRAVSKHIGESSYPQAQHCDLFYMPVENPMTSVWRSSLSLGQLGQNEPSDSLPTKGTARVNGQTTGKLPVAASRDKVRPGTC